MPLDGVFMEVDVVFDPVPVGLFGTWTVMLAPHGKMQLFQ